MNTKNQNLIKMHSYLGIFLGLFFFIIVYFAMFALMQDYIKSWEKPSRHLVSAVKNENIALSKLLKPILSNQEIPKNNIRIYLPGYKEDKALIVAPAFSKKIVLNPSDGKILEDEGKQKTALSSFLHNMHTGWQLFKNIGFTFFGFVSLLIIFLILLGIVQVFKIKYTNNGLSKSSKMSKWHRKLSLWFFLPVLLIFISASALNLQIKGIKQLSSPLVQMLSNNESESWKTILGPVLFPKEKIIKKQGLSKMMKLEVLYEKVKQLNPNIQFSYINLYRWGDKTAQAKFTGYDTRYPFFNGYNNMPSITLSGIDAALIKETKVFDVNALRIVFDFVNFLHFVPFFGFLMKFLLLLVFLVFTFATVFGIWLFLEKKSKTTNPKLPFYSCFQRVCLSVIVGILPATAMLFLMQWLLAFDLSYRVTLQEGSFFITWLISAVIAFARLNSYKATKEILYLASILFLLAVLVHYLNAPVGFFSLLNSGLFNIIGVDIALLLFAFFCFLIAYKLPNNAKEKTILLRRF